MFICCSLFFYLGDLYFAYALPADDTGGGFYRCSTYNPYLDVTAGGSYTQLTVIGSEDILVKKTNSIISRTIIIN